MTWAVLIAVFLFICGFGKFLDDYHLRSSAKSKARDFLIRRFIALEEAHAPDPAATMARAISRLLRRRKVIMGFAFVSVAYVLIILIFYVARQRYGVGFPGSFGQYLVSWMPNNTENILWTAVLDRKSVV